jgi:histidinol dehydrogenase
VEFFRRLSARGNEEGGNGDVEARVRDILEDVRARGDDALLENTRRFDCPGMEPPLEVGAEALRRAASSIPREDRDVIAGAAGSIREFHEAQKGNSWFMTRPDGTILGQKAEAVERVGLYVPGGRGGDTPLISSLLMAAVTARVAGVAEISVASPPRKDGTLNPHLLAAACLLEIDKVYRVGGPWSIGAFAFGTRSVAPVDVIAGPGNIFVTTAKKLVQGKVGIDMLAGPSEILVLADDGAPLEWIAADMLSQAEHDPLASAVCVTTSRRIAEALPDALRLRLAGLPRAGIAAEALKIWGAVIHVPDLAAAVDIANAAAPEHLEVLTGDPWALLPHIRHAGAIFLGPYSPEAVGDYYAGPNHVLPTHGTARHASALSVETFRRKTSIIAASPSFTKACVRAIARLARLEGLEAHARSVEERDKL